MKTNLISLKNCLAFLFVALLMVSCSKKADVFEKIPQSSRFVLVANPLQFAKKVNKDVSQIKGIKPDAAQRIKDYLSGDFGLDSENVVVFEYDNSVYCAIAVTDEGKLMSKLKGTKSEVDGVTIFEDGEECFAIKDGICWFGTASEKMAKDVVFFTLLDPAKSVAAKKNFAKNIGGGDFGGYLNIGAVYSSDVMEKSGLSYDMIPYFDKVKNADLFYVAEGLKDDLKITSHIYDAEGNNLLDIMNLPEFDADLLKFIDNKSSVVYSFTFDEYTKDAIKKIVDKEITDEFEKTTAKTVLNNVAGSFAFGFRLNNAFTEDLTMTVVAKLKDDGEANLKTILDAKYKADANGVYEISDIRTPIRLGFKDGCVYMTNGVLADNNFKSNAGAKYFDDASGSLYVDFTEGSFLSTMGTAVLGKPLAGFLYLKVGDEKGEFVIHVDKNDTDNFYNFVANLF